MNNGVFWLLSGVSALAALAFAVLGILFFCGRGASLIAGYSEASREEHDREGLCRFMGKCMLLSAVGFPGTLMGIALKNPMLWGCGGALLLLTGIFMVYYLKLGTKEKREKDSGKEYNGNEK